MRGWGYGEHDDRTRSRSPRRKGGKGSDGYMSAFEAGYRKAMGKGKPMVLIKIPDGKSKDVSVVKSKVDPFENWQIQMVIPGVLAEACYNTGVKLHDDLGYKP